MAGEEFAERARGYCKVGRTVSKLETVELESILENLKLYLRQQALQQVQASGKRPLLFCYQSDGTRNKTKYKASLQGPIEGQPVVRYYYEGHEYLMQVGYGMSLEADGSPQYKVVLADPVALRAGESTWCLWSAARDFLPTLKKMGHLGISVHHYVFDRKYYTSLGRCLSQRHKWLLEEFPQLNETEAKRASMTNWQ
eukprot:3156854-Lingulodinium_polyedra.AAC.1